MTRRSQRQVHAFRPAPRVPRVRRAGWLAVALALAAVSLAPGGVAPALADDARLLAHLDALLAAGQAAEAIAAAEGALAGGEVAPRNEWRVQQRLGAAYVAAGRPGAAVPVLEAALQVAPGDAALHLNLARALRDQGRPGRAVSEFGLAVDLAPDRADWRLEYAAALADLGIRRDALAQIRLARRLCGDCAPALRGEVNHHLAFGDATAAIEPLQALHAHEPSPAVRSLLARSLGAAGEDAAVQALLDTVAAAGLTGAEALALARADRALGTAGRAVALAAGTRALPADWQPPAEFWALAAETALAAGEPAAALRAIDRALALAPAQALLHHNRAAILLALGREDEARRALAEARRLDPGLGGPE